MARSRPAERIVLVGQGGYDDVESALVRIAKAFDFEVVVVDPDPRLTEPPHRLVRAPLPDPRRLGLNERDSVIVLTTGERDVAVLESIARTPLRYVGLWADEARVERNRTELKATGVPDDFLRRLRAPTPGERNARAPSEIALSILSEIVDSDATTHAGALARSSAGRTGARDA